MACCSCYRMPHNAFFLRTRDLLVSPKMTRRHFLSTLHPLFPVIFAIATVVAFVVLLIVLFGSSRFNFHCYTQREATPTQKSARKWHCDLSQLLAQKITKGIHLCKPTSLNYPIVKLRVGVYIYIHLLESHCLFSVWPDEALNISQSNVLHCALLSLFTDMMKQGQDLSVKPHIVISTPGRLADHIDSCDTFSLSRVKFLVSCTSFLCHCVRELDSLNLKLEIIVG